jgi:hypothetical protein
VSHYFLLPVQRKIYILKLEAIHFEAFEKIKITLLTTPLFCHLTEERATKYMFVDTCTTISILGCTLCKGLRAPKGKGYYLHV